MKIGQFSTGYYKLRNGEIALLSKVHIINGIPNYFGHNFQWNQDGINENSAYDLMEYLQVRENNFEGPSVFDLFPDIKDKDEWKREWD